MVKIYLIAGETSGDFIGGRLMQSLKDLYTLDGTAVKFEGVGGKNMQEAGLGVSLFPIEQINLMGFVEIIPHIFAISKLIDRTINDIVEQAPNLLITIDSPGFTYRVAKKVRQLIPKLKIIHIVAPSVWAYKPSRALKYAKIYDYLLALLPFEPPYFQKVGLNCQYIGHPIIEQNFYDEQAKPALRQELNIALNSKIISVTCGSRPGEIIKHIPVFMATLNMINLQYPNLEVIFVIANHRHQSLIESFLAKATFNYRFSNDRLKIFSIADVALAKSGTNTLEITASGTPLVVAYKLNIVSFLLIKLLIKIPYISLINIIANRKILPEFIQYNCTSDNLANSLITLMSDNKKATEQVQDSRQILKKLYLHSSLSPSKLAANIIKSIF